MTKQFKSNRADRQGHKPPQYDEAMVHFTVRVPKSLFKQLRKVSALVVRGILAMGLNELYGVKPIKGVKLSELDKGKGEQI